jgi:hypothetical protein
MAGMPGGGRFRPRLWSRKAEVLRWAAVGLARSQAVWFGAGIALLAGLWCQRSAALAQRLEDRDEAEVEADVPGD